MLTDRVLRELLDFNGSAGDVLSVYFDLGMGDSSIESKKLLLRSMIKDFGTPEDQAAIMHYFDYEWDRGGRSLAMFSNVAQGFFRAYSFAVSLRSRVRMGAQPYIKPLADLLNAYGGYGVVLVDKQGARLFSFHLGELQEQEGVMGDQVRHTKRGIASSLPGRRGGTAGQSRHSDDVSERNLKEAVKFAVKFFEENHIRRILIGGTDENVAQFRSYLPKAWQSLFIGDFPISMTANHAEVLARALEIGHQVEQVRESRLVNAAITAAAKGDDGVVRLDDTLEAVRQGRVKTLIVKDGYHEPGYQCNGCEYISVQQLGECPFCGNRFELIPDAVELAVRKVFQDSGEVEIVHDNADLEKVGIAAILRY